MPVQPEKNTASHFSIILLAAGASSRLGKPKQLLQYHGKSLVQHAVQAAKDSNCSHIFIVLGANADLIAKEIDQEKSHVIINDAWKEGMASSIRCGIQVMTEIAPSSEAAILMVCDQPHISASLLNDLINTHLDTGKPIITCSYENTFGPPALFHKSIFPELLQLHGDTGARKVVQLHAHEIGIVSFPQGNIDIDTEVDYQKLQDGDDGSL